MSGPAPAAEQTAYYTGRPPAAIASLKPSPVSLPGVSFDGHGSPINACFELTCECGGKGFYVLAHDGADWVVDPVSVRCAACSKQTVIFDGRSQGYDGALGNLPETPLPTTPIQELFAETLGASPYRVAVRYEYADDVLGDPEYADWKGRESELFTWFTVVARPMAGDAAESVFDQECS